MSAQAELEAARGHLAGVQARYYLREGETREVDRKVAYRATWEELKTAVAALEEKVVAAYQERHAQELAADPLTQGWVPLERGERRELAAAQRLIRLTELAAMGALDARDAAWEALRAVLKRWDEVLPSIKGVEAFAHTHGWRYSGPEGGMVPAIEQARAALPASEKAEKDWV